MQELQTIDWILYGGAGLATLLLFAVFNGDAGERKLRQRIRHVTRQESAQPGAKPVSISRQRDTSLNTIGLADIAERLANRLNVAGISMTARHYLTLCLILAFVVLFVVTVLLARPFLLGMLTGFIVGAGLPHLYVNWRMKRRQQRFLRLFPDALELIVRGLRAGLPVGEAMQNIAEEIPDPVGPLFREICAQLALGVPFEKAMADMANRLRLTEFNFFVISTVLQRETGGNLGEILSNLADVLRQRHIMKLKIKAMSAEARASAMIVGSLPFLVVLAIQVMSPGYLIPLFEDSRGNIAGIAAICSLCIGMFCMARLARFEI